jgi:hypothetical protein
MSSWSRSWFCLRLPVRSDLSPKSSLGKLEAHRYSAAHESFTLGKAELEAIDRSNADDKLSHKRDIVLALGQKALLENEDWLRANRERPVEQVVE